MVLAGNKQQLHLWIRPSVKETFHVHEGLHTKFFGVKYEPRVCLAQSEFPLMRIEAARWMAKRSFLRVVGVVLRGENEDERMKMPWWWGRMRDEDALVVEQDEGMKMSGW